MEESGVPFRLAGQSFHQLVLHAVCILQYFAIIAVHGRYGESNMGNVKGG
jgi:hypothetical protein